MNIADLFRKAVAALQEAGVPFAVAGGFAADVYRSEHRVTADVDVSIVVETDPVTVATGLIESLGLHAAVARKADLEGGPLFAIRRRTTAPYMVVGRQKGNPKGPGVDVLLPAMPWVSEAVRRAQFNCRDFGFGPVPVLTVEDVVLAKLSALKYSPQRFKDLDDLASIFAARPDLDMKYLAGQMKHLDLAIPRSLLSAVPAGIAKVSRDIEGTRKT